MADAAARRASAGGLTPACRSWSRVYNEAAGLRRAARTHRRGRAPLKAARAACHRGGLRGRRQPRRHARGRAAACPPIALDVQVVSLSRNFGKEAALLAGLDHARLRRRAVHGRRRPASARAGRDSWSAIGSMTATTWSTPPRRIARTSRGCAASACKAFYALINWGARQKIPEDAGDFRLLSPRAAAALKQLPERNRFFKGLASWIGFRQIRVDYEPAERIHGRTHLELVFAARPLDRGPHLVLGRAAAAREPARAAARGAALHLRRADPDRDASSSAVGAGLSVGGRRPDGARRRAAHHDRHHGRIYRQDPLRAEGAAGLFRGRAHAQDGREPQAAAGDPPARSAAE